MQVINKSQYITTIYSAVVVNVDKNQDPDNKSRVQIYIPSVNYEFADKYQEYMNNGDKPNSPYFSEFPWAITLIDGLKIGDDIYGSYIEGNNTQYIILGLEGGTSSSVDNAGNLNIDASDIVNLTMPIIMHNEIGVALNAWTDNTIPDSKFGSITLHDGGERNSSGGWAKQGCWAIGLIQWNGVRAYDTCYEIAKADGNWKSYFSHECDLKSALSSSLSSQSTTNQRGNFSLEKGWNPEKGGATYNSIVALISSLEGKDVQKRLAYDDTANIINGVMDAGCNNKAILIYLADFYNQYGAGHATTTQKAVEACNQGGDMMEQLDWLINNQIKPNFSSFNTYKARRNTTYNYIKELYTAGKLNDTNLTDENSGNSPQISGTGQYCIPYEGVAEVSATWGKGGYHRTGGYHTGIDFAMETGRKLYACTSGTIKHLSSYGLGISIMADDGNMIIYGHCSSRKAPNGSKVNKGDLIAYSGNTGHSTGPHLHFEIRKSPYKYSENGGGDDINPFPFIGLNGNHDWYGKNI